MQQLLMLWNGLTLKRQIIVVAATVTMFAAILALSALATRPSMSLLYSSLESDTAGDVIDALERQGAAYEVRGTSIFVDSSLRDTLRMTLASEGLPANSAQGYELLDALSGFGTTSQMFDAAYWRAKEGELARTITAAPHIRAARVHIANAESRPFERHLRSAASVTIQPAGADLSHAQARALRYLVASAVAGLAPEDVTVIDARNGLVLGDAAAEGVSDSGNRQTELKQSIERLLEARVGYGNAVVEVSVETETERETITERLIDPESRVAISSDTEERSNNSTSNGASAVTVSSNLPDGTANGSGQANTRNSETRERVNYEISETMREVQRAPGAVRRISVAVLVDGVRRTNPETGATEWQPRSDEELASLEALVSSAAGLNTARGDTITIRSMEFEPLAQLEPVAQPGLLSRMALDVMTLIQVAVLAVVSLVVGLMVVRPIMMQRATPALAAPSQTSLPPIMPSAAPAIDPLPAPPALPSLTGEIADDFDGPKMAVVSDFDLGDDFGPSSDPVKRLQRLIEDRRPETVEILRSWMDETGATT